LFIWDYVTKYFTLQVNALVNESYVNKPTRLKK